MNTNTPTQISITNDERGQAMIEFAGSIIIFIMLYLLLITIGLRIADYSALQKVARDGGRAATITGNISDSYNKAAQTAWMWKLDPYKTTVYLNTHTYGSRTMLTCDTQYRSSPFATIFPTMMGNEPVDQKILTGRATFGWYDYEH